MDDAQSPKFLTVHKKDSLWWIMLRILYEQNIKSTKST